ncbi:MAG: hypothetical protein M3Y13_07150 [Armatimonadota bacterium]|nr:hypothetical protein [Armatimonadota bacterium]
MSRDETNQLAKNLRNGTRIDRALQRSVREALLEHKRLGQEIVVWCDGKVVIVPPEEIEIPEQKSTGS